MANIRLKELVEANVDPKLVARSKETGKLVYFKNAQNKDAAMKAGTHLDPKAKKGDEPKVDAKPNDMFGGDYKKDRGAETPKVAAPKADVKSIIKGLLKTADKDFAHAWDLKDSSVEIIDYIYDEDEDGKELKARLEAGEDGTYVQTDEMEGTIVFNDGSQYQAVGDMMGDVNITKVGKEEPKTSSKLTSMLPKKASQLNYKHSNIVADTVNKEAGLDGYAQTDDNSGAIIYNAGKDDMPTYTLYMGSNVDYGKPDEFRVSLEPTYGNDPSGLQGKHDKSFKSSKDAMTYMTALAKKYKKEMQMDDSKTSSKLSTMMPKSEPTPKIVGNWKYNDEDGRMSSDAADDVRNHLNNILGVDGMAEVDFGSGNIAYGLSDSENSIFVGYADGTYNVSYEGPSVDIDTINKSYKSFKNPKDALVYAGELAKANRKGLEQKYTNNGE